MLHTKQIWKIIKNNMPKEKWIPITDIYQLVEDKRMFDKEGFLPQSPVSSIPKWKRNVRCVLQYRKGRKEIMWDGNANYLLP